MCTDEGSSMLDSDWKLSIGWPFHILYFKYFIISYILRCVNFSLQQMQWIKLILRSVVQSERVTLSLWVNIWLMSVQLSCDDQRWDKGGYRGLQTLMSIMSSSHFSSRADQERPVPSCVHWRWKSCRSAGLWPRRAVKCCCRPEHQQWQMDEHHSPVRCIQFTKLCHWKRHHCLRL